MSYQTDLQTGVAWLHEHDPRLAVIIDGQPLPSFSPHQDYYAALVSSIIGQQLSVKAAATIKQRFNNLFDGQLPTPEQIIDTDHEALRSAGLSNAKANYIRDLAEHVLDGRISFEAIPTQSNDEIITMLCDVKGIGEWTVHMFLMFCVGRLDVLAHGDLGVRSAIRMQYALETMPSPALVAEIATKYSWQPYASIACWYLWRSLDNAPKLD